MAVLETDSAVPGRFEVVCEWARRLGEACHSGRARAGSVVVVAVDDSVASISRHLSGPGSEHVRFVDAFARGSGWPEAPAAGGGGPAPESPLGEGGLERLCRAVASAAAAGPPCAVLVHSLSTLAQFHGTAAALAAARRLAGLPAVASVGVTVHGAFHGDRELEVLRGVARCHARLEPASALQEDFARAQHGCPGGCGRLRAETRRRRRWAEGAAHASEELFALPASGPPGVRFFPPPATTAGAKELADAALRAGADGAAAGPPPAPGEAPPGVVAELSRVAGMSLSLTEEQQRAKAGVVLPYEHVSGSDRYATTDFQSYLPPAAGGTGQGRELEGAGRLGHILYVRDTDSERDSDEDPDEDLDI